MKAKILWLSFMFLVLAPATKAQNNKPVWLQMKAFHGYMSASFHSAEEGNFIPLRQKADSLLIAAKNWQESPVPTDFKPAETKVALAKLAAKCIEVKKAVGDKASDAQLLKLINDAHDIFHTITGECRKTEE